MLGISDPDDPWFRLIDAIRQRRADHIKQTMAGDLDPAQYAATTGRYAEDDHILGLIHQIRRNEDVSPRAQPRESVGAQYGV